MNEALPIYLKRAVTKDAGEDGSGQHGEDGQDHRHAGCGTRDEKYREEKYEKDMQLLRKMKMAMIIKNTNS